MNTIVRIIVIAVLGLAFQNADARSPHHRSDKERKEWFEKMKQAQNDYMARELELSDKQRAEFFPLYDKHMQERMNAERELRHAEKELADKGKGATDADYTRLIEMQYSLDSRLNEIDRKYVEKYRKFLSPKQVFDIKGSERRFRHKLMRQRNCPPPAKTVQP